MSYHGSPEHIQDLNDQIEEHKDALDNLDPEHPNHGIHKQQLIELIRQKMNLVAQLIKNLSGRSEVSESYDLFESKEEIKRLRKENAKLIDQYQEERDPEKKNKIHKKIQNNIKKRKELESGKKARPKKTATLAESIMRIHRDVLLEQQMATLVEGEEDWEKPTTIKQRLEVLWKLQQRRDKAETDEERKFHEEDIDGMIKSIRKSQKDAKK